MNILNFLTNLFLKVKKSDLEKRQKMFTEEYNKNKILLNPGINARFKTNLAPVLKEIEEETKLVVKPFLSEPEKIVKILEERGINIYRTRYSYKLLSFIDESEGFIQEIHGLNALYFNIVFGILCSAEVNNWFKTEPAFVMSDKTPDPYLLALHIHKYFGYKNNLPGYDYKSQKYFKKLFKRPFNKYLNKLSASDISGIKEAILRDEESTDFAIALREKK